MKKIVIIVVIVVLCGGFLWLNSRSANNQSVNPFVPTQPGDIVGNVQVCLGPRDYCEALAKAQQEQIENQQEQFKLSLTAQAPPKPTATPTWYPGLKQEEDEARKNMLIAAGVVIIVIGTIAGMFWAIGFAWRKIRVDPKRAREAPNGKKVGTLTVFVVPPPEDEFDAKATIIAVDENAQGTAMMVQRGDKLTHLRLTDNAAAAVAMSHALSTAANRDPARNLLGELSTMFNGVAQRQYAALTAGVEDTKPAPETASPAAPAATLTPPAARPRVERKSHWWDGLTGRQKKN